MSSFHPRNRHRGRYDFARLLGESPELKRYVRPNPGGDSTIDFADPEAVKALNRAILAADYGVAGWDIPAGFLCPAIPGRADSIHHAADLLAELNGGKIPKGPATRVLDVGTGANLAYPLIGRAEYGWSFVGSDVDPVALDSARAILRANPAAEKDVELRRQDSPGKIFAGIVKPEERFALSICNPPFHASLEEAEAGTRRKWKNLGKADDRATANLNFGGRAAELACEGGERGFILRMVAESAGYAARFGWFTTLVSKETNLPSIEKALARVRAKTRVVEMSTGQKKSRLVAWRFPG